MAKKELIEITPEGLNLLTVLNYSYLPEMNGFYGKEVYFTAGFNGDTQYLFQALGNLGSFARNKDIESDIAIVIISNSIIDSSDKALFESFKLEFESKLNQNNSPYRKMKFISENHLIWYVENRVKITEDTQLDELIRKYKKSNKIIVQQNLFE